MKDVCRWTIAAVTLVSILTAGCTQTDSEPGNGANPGAGVAGHATNDLKGKVQPIPVRVVVVKEGTITDSVLLPCTTEAYRTVKVSAEIAGRVVSMAHDEGQTVKNGEVLFELDPKTIGAELAKAQANYDLAETTFKRIKSLVEGKQLPETQLDQTRAQRDVAKAELETIQVRLEKAVLRSPLDGHLERRYVDVGEYVMAGNAVADIVEIERLKVVVQVPERHGSYVCKGCPMLVRFGVNGEGTFTGTVLNVDRLPDPVTRTYRTEVVIENKDLLLRPGMIGRTVLALGEPHQGISVPLESVIARKGRRYVVVDMDGRAVERDVSLGVLEGQRVEVTEGLAPGERLIVVGHRELIDGDPVQVLEQDNETD